MSDVSEMHNAVALAALSASQQKHQRQGFSEKGKEAHLVASYYNLLGSGPPITLVYQKLAILINTFIS